MIVRFRKITKLVLILCFCVCVTSAKKYQCSNITSVERFDDKGYMNFTVKIPYPSTTDVIVTSVHISAKPEVIVSVELLLAKSDEEVRTVFREEGVVSYALTFDSTLPAPNLLKVEISTRDHCILFCDGGQDFRTGVNKYTLTQRSILDMDFPLKTGYSHCTDFKPLYSPLPENCGETRLRRVNYTTEIERGTWPWLVPILYRTSRRLSFKCGGNIISPQTILTAAHCFVSKKNIVYKAEQVVTFVGRHNLDDFNERGFVAHYAKEIVMHPGFQWVGRHSSRDDIALINLAEEIVFTDSIQPVCLWRYSTDVESLVGMDAFVAGWGKKNNGRVTPVPHILEQTITGTDICKQSNEGYSGEDFNATICALGWDGTGPCQGDSGGGLILMEKDQRYAIRGLVSITLADDAESGCGLDNYVAYTDVAKYYDWIRTEMT